MVPNANRLRVGNDPADLAIAFLQAGLDTINIVMDMLHCLVWSTMAMIVQEQALVIAA